jgi:hypothetical protein
MNRLASPPIATVHSSNPKKREQEERFTKVPKDDKHLLSLFWLVCSRGGGSPASSSSTTMVLSEAEWELGVFYSAQALLTLYRTETLLGKVLGELWGLAVY